MTPTQAAKALRDAAEVFLRVKTEEQDLDALRYRAERLAAQAARLVNSIEAKTGMVVLPFWLSEAKGGGQRPPGQWLPDTGQHGPFQTTDSEQRWSMTWETIVLYASVRWPDRLPPAIVLADTAPTSTPPPVAILRSKLDAWAQTCEVLAGEYEAVGSMNNVHSEDFRAVTWGGAQYAFNPMQARCIEVLWHAWEQGLPGLSEADIGASETVDSEAERFRLRRIFMEDRRAKRMHPAWDTMIQKRGGLFTLAPMGT